MEEYNELNVKEYFSKKSEEYDSVEEQVYWQLSDKLLWNVFKEKILSKLPQNFKFLDAGGGTGRWTIKILNEFPEAQGTIYDFSESMLKQAIKKLENKNYLNRCKIVIGNLEKIDLLEEGSFDLVFNFHNVLGFVNNTQKALNEMTRVLKKNGLLVSFIPNLYHLIFFNIFLGNVDNALEYSEEKKGKFVNDMPSINIFSLQAIEKLYSKSGLDLVNIYGFPITIYPGYQETQLGGSTKKIADLLSNKENFDKIYEIERKFLCRETASRGNNLFVTGKKT